MRNRLASLALLIPLLVQGLIEIGKIIVAIIQSPPDPPKKGERDDT